MHIKPSETLEVLSEGFYSACSPQISYDGAHILFSGKKNQNDPWSIWEMNIDGSDFRQITTGAEDCTNPVYLPSGRVAFSKSLINFPAKTGQPLFVCNIDGSDMKQITFSPDEDIISSVLLDGRILITTRPLYPSEKDPMMMVLRPDGTKKEIFYINQAGKVLPGSARQTSEGSIVFLETDSSAKNRNLVSISYNRPLHSRKVLASGVFSSVVPWKEGKMLVSFRKNDSSGSGLYEFDTAAGSYGTAIYETSGSDITDIAIAEEHTLPKKLPSEVDTGVKTGLLFIQDIKINDNQEGKDGIALPAAHSIEIMGIDSTLGIVDAEADGSVYLKVISDTPLRSGHWMLRGIFWMVPAIGSGYDPMNGAGAWAAMRIMKWYRTTGALYQ